MRMTAVGELRHSLRFSGAKVVFSKTADTTRECHRCGQLCEWDQAADLTHTCEHCGATWDQDDNAALNLLARGVTSIETEAAARKTESQAPLGVELNNDAA